MVEKFLKIDDGEKISDITANLTYWAVTHPYIVHDALEGRREIPPGTGEVQICMGFKFEYDEFGRPMDVPVFQTRVF